MNTDERYSRQRDLVPLERLATCRGTVVGIGAIGRQVALQLTAMGITWLQLIDFDTVEESNIASQGYLEKDLGRLKVEATADLCRQINTALEIHTVPRRFRRSVEVGNCLFCCVDTIETRRLIWESVKDRVTFFADGRMAAEVIRILVACDEESRKHYPTTLFPPEEAYTGSCTARSTIYTANIAAGLMLAQSAKWVRGLPADADTGLNLISMELGLSWC